MYSLSCSGVNRGEYIMVLSCVSVYAQGQQAGFSRNGVPHLILKKQRYILRMDISLKHKNIIFILLPYLSDKYTHRHTFFGFSSRQN